jgi:protein TonB
MAASLGAHALLLFGFVPSAHPLPPIVDDPPEVPPMAVRLYREDPEIIPENGDGARRDEPSTPVPSLPEPPVSPRSQIDVEMRRPPDVSVDYDGPRLTRIPAAWSPAGEKIGSGGPPVLPAHLLDNPPHATYRAAPAYPFEARRTGLSGEVVVEFVVNERGEVLVPSVVRSSAQVFDEPTLRAVARWKFEPGRKDGRPVRFRMSVPVVFNVHE